MSNVTVIGGGGVAGTAIVATLERGGHRASAVSRRAGVDLLTTPEAELTAALRGVDVVVDAFNTPATRKGGRDLVRGTGRAAAAARAAGVGHYVLVSIAGIDRVPTAYYRAKVAQEQALGEARIPATIVRSTQFYDLIVHALDVTGRWRVLPAPATQLRPIAPADVARVVADVVRAGPPAPGDGVAVRTITGPQPGTLCEWAGRLDRARGIAPRRRVPVRFPGRLGAALASGALCGPPDAPRGTTSLEQWLAAA